MVSIIEYWREIGSTVAGIVLFLAGRKSTKILEKQQEVDAVATMQKTYDTFLGHYNNQYQKLTDQVDKLQKAFIDLQLAYAKEIEKVEQSRAPPPVYQNAEQTQLSETTAAQPEQQNIGSSQEPSIPINTVEIPEVSPTGINQSKKLF